MAAVKMIDFHEGDYVCIKVPVVRVPGSSDLHVAVCRKHPGGKTCVEPKLIDIEITAHFMIIRKGDYIRDLGSKVLGGPRFGRVTGFITSSGIVRDEPAEFAICLMEGDGLGEDSRPSVFNVNKIERVPTSQLSPSQGGPSR